MIHVDLSDEKRIRRIGNVMVAQGKDDSGKKWWVAQREGKKLSCYGISVSEAVQCLEWHEQH